jgi:Zn-dependent peptidase ImmA (M78 family)
MTNWLNPIIQEYIRYMGIDPITAFKKECDYLYKTTNQNNSNTFEAINIDEIAKFLNLKDETYFYKDLQGIKGQLKQTTDYNIKIELNGNVKNSKLYRFIIAHEIGHWVIHSKVSKIFSDEEKFLIDKFKFEEELLCHHFASEILMPENIFLASIRNKKLNNQLIQSLSNTFKVPDYQIINRIVQTNPNQFAIYWKNKNSPTSSIKELRVKNIFPNRKLRLLPFIPINATAKSDRFKPNIITESFNTEKSISAKVNISNFGAINGSFDVFVFNPSKSNSLFDQFERNFDLISIISH